MLTLKVPNELVTPVNIKNARKVVFWQIVMILNVTRIHPEIILADDVNGKTNGRKQNSLVGEFAPTKGNDTKNYWS